MKKGSLVVAMVLVPILIMVGLVIAAFNSDLVIFQPAGEVAQRQRDLLVFALLLSMIIIIPVFALTLFIGIRYRASNYKATFRPNWSHSRTLETIWWGLPILVIIILGVVTWRTTHSLNPYKPLASNKPPLRVQVVALQWRWLFIYPEQGIATINKLEIPTGRTVEFKITSDAPMNSFWIPKLGGQIYAMSGMVTTLHLSADQAGNYTGSSANISGEGFADMNFSVRASSPSEFDDWILATSNLDTPMLSSASYSQLAEPSNDTSAQLFARVDSGLFDGIVSKYMSHNKSQTAGTESSVPTRATHKGDH